MQLALALCTASKMFANKMFASKMFAQLSIMSHREFSVELKPGQCCGFQPQRRLTPSTLELCTDKIPLVIDPCAIPGICIDNMTGLQSKLETRALSDFLHCAGFSLG